MTADIYNAKQLAAGVLTVAHVTKLVRFWQAHNGLAPDGMAGPATLAKLSRAEFRLSWPLPTLTDGRQPAITSGFKTRNPGRPNHDGVDLFYPWQPGDKPDFVGDHGAAGRGSAGQPKWGVPHGTMAIAAASGIVMASGDTPTGWRVWIDHGNGLRTGYFHLLGAAVVVGQRVEVGAELGPVGDNPRDGDARHLHFELSPTVAYLPMDPEPYLQ